MDNLQKTSYGNSFSTMLQDQMEKLLKTFVDIKKYVDENSRHMKTFSLLPTNRRQRPSNRRKSLLRNGDGRRQMDF
jgi:hypothetical protein